jgi:hypothetical protein
MSRDMSRGEEGKIPEIKNRTFAISQSSLAQIFMSSLNAVHKIGSWVQRKCHVCLSGSLSVCCIP